jgi:predicted AlkP superfamily pyrophosphatase or phosphodiesterase
MPAVQASDFGPRGRPTIDRVLPSVAAALDVPGFSADLELPPAPRYVVLVVDGLGRHLLHEHADAAPFLSSQAGIDDLVCGVPSTTATSLTSLSTGLTVGRHGLAGYTCRVPATGKRINLLVWDQPVEPDLWQPHPSVLATIGRTGMLADVVNESKFEGSGLTRCTHQGVPYHGINSSWERLDVVLDVVESAPRGLVYTYESRLDHAGHRDGSTSEAWRDMLHTIDAEAQQLRAELPTDTVLLVTADHGMVDLPAEDRFDLDTVPSLRDGVELVAGEARLRHLYVEPGAGDDVVGRWSEVVGERAIVERREDLADWFGPIDPEVRGRIGDVIVASLDEFAVFSSADFPQEFMLKGFHGSVSEAELAIPLLVSAG